MNKEEFDTKIAYLKEYSPNHRFLSKLSQGFSYINSVYLQTAIDELPPPVKREDTPGQNDFSLDRAKKQLSDLYSISRKASNKLHLVQSKLEAITIIDDILDTQCKIADQQHNIRYYEEYNMPLATAEEKEEFPIPQNIFEIRSVIHKIQTSKTRLEKDILAKINKGLNVAKQQETMLKYTQYLTKLTIAKKAYEPQEKS